MNKWKARPNAKCISVWVDPKTIEMLEVLKEASGNFNYQIIELAVQSIFQKHQHLLLKETNDNRSMPTGY
jgi:ABC-type uncharacterized transport system substrate-binding protein